MKDVLKAKAQRLFVPITVFSVDYNKFESFIQEAYGVKNYSVVADQELGNDSTKTFHVKAKELDTWETKDLEDFIEGKNVNFVTSTLLQNLCNKGIIETGQYNVDICW